MRWAGDEDMQALEQVARQLAAVRAEHESRERDLIEQRDALVDRLHTRGAPIIVIAPRAGVSDSLISRRLKRVRAVVPSPRP